MVTAAVLFYCQELHEPQPAAKTCLVHRGTSTAHSESAIKSGCNLLFPEVQWHTTIALSPKIHFLLSAWL